MKLVLFSVSLEKDDTLRHLIVIVVVSTVARKFDKTTL